jgi:hypothetical protein
MRALVILLALTMPASADRNANFSATLVGAAADTAGVTLVHGKSTWSMKLGKRTIATSEPSQHGDYFVVVAPGRTWIAWVRFGDIKEMPVTTDVAIRFYRDSHVRTVRFGQLFSKDELKDIEQSTGGWRWVINEPVVVKDLVTLPTTTNVPVVIDASAGTATRKH